MFCPDKKNFYVGRVIYIFLCCTSASVCRCDGDVMCVEHDLNRCSGWW